MPGQFIVVRTMERMRDEARLAIFLSRLFVNRFDLSIDHVAGEAIDRDVEPVSLFALDQKLSELEGVRREMAGFRAHHDYQFPNACLKKLGKPAGDALLLFLGAP